MRYEGGRSKRIGRSAKKCRLLAVAQLYPSPFSSGAYLLAIVKASQTLEVAKEVLSRSHPALGQRWPVITAREGRGRLTTLQRWSLLMHVCIFSTIELSGLEKNIKNRAPLRQRPAWSTGQPQLHSETLSRRREGKGLGGGYWE